MQQALLLVLLVIAFGHGAVFDHIPASGIVLTHNVTSFAGAILYNLSSTTIDVSQLSVRLTCDLNQWADTTEPFGMFQCNQGAVATAVILRQAKDSGSQAATVSFDLRELELTPVLPGETYLNTEPVVYVFQTSSPSVGVTPMGRYYTEASIWAWPVLSPMNFTFELQPYPSINFTDNYVIVYQQNNLMCVEDQCSVFPKLSTPDGGLLIIDQAGNLTFQRTENVTWYEAVGPSVVSVWPYPPTTLLATEGEHTVECVILGQYTVAHMAVPSRPLAVSQFYDTYYLSTPTSFYVGQTQNTALLDCFGQSRIVVNFNYSYCEERHVSDELLLNLDVKPFSATFYNVTYNNEPGTIMHCPGSLNLLDSSETIDDYLVDTQSFMVYYYINQGEEAVEDSLDIYILETITVTGPTLVNTTNRNVLVKLEPPPGYCLYVDIQNSVTIDDSYKCPGGLFLSDDTFSDTDYFYAYVCSQYCTIIVSADEDYEELSTPIGIVEIKKADWGQNVAVPGGVNVYQFPGANATSVISIENTAANATNAVTSIDFGTELRFNSEQVTRSFVKQGPVYAAFVQSGRFVAHISDESKSIPVSQTANSQTTVPSTTVAAVAGTDRELKCALFFTIGMLWLAL